MFLLIILAYIIIGIIEILPLIKRNQKKELAVYLITFIGAFVISLLLSLGVKIPSPAKPLEKAVKAIINI
ncbi:hypothetical protein SAMN02745883_00952 [Caminicella sporogenes DSM 14501]|uniref:Uncharacterized protein n=1 Tax=Caminicella sporogenes DSM 14501 TaxID=1121266 RepID=A0A1M6NNF6_9FIRM|nr:hypothetical protein [Caminicella sporogenes]RKD22146.1 hypothetical protein BET04_05840 [Caminicella sporogenes]SHJ97102.1 hypothetical protein SAMN02745883_00952 [Caminicella sporogenes DSM 14501]